MDNPIAVADSLYQLSIGEDLDRDQQLLIGIGQLLLLPPGYDCDYQRAPGCERWVHRWLRFTPPPDWLVWSPALRRSERLSLLPLDGGCGRRADCYWPAVRRLPR